MATPSRRRRRDNVDKDCLLFSGAVWTADDELISSGVAARRVVDAQPEVDPGEIVPPALAVCRYRLTVMIIRLFDDRWRLSIFVFVKSNAI